jgi:hypothetical protein
VVTNRVFLTVLNWDRNIQRFIGVNPQLLTINFHLQTEITWLHLSRVLNPCYLAVLYDLSFRGGTRQARAIHESTIDQSTINQSSNQLMH